MNLSAANHLRKSTLLLFLAVASAAAAQSNTSCSDPTSPDCVQPAQTVPTRDSLQTTPITTPAAPTQRNDQNPQLYVDSAGNRTRNPNQILDPLFAPDPVTDMQRLAEASTGEHLTIFGRDLFERAPSTFAPADQIPALADYVVGPGDQVLLRLFGPESFNGELTVDSSGSIYVPQVGAIHVAGLRADELQTHITADLKHTFRNFNLSVNLGHLRSIQVYVVGEARRPGAFTVSSLSTLLNVLFVAGGPNVQGSLRDIQVRRSNGVVAHMDLYDLLLKGDKSQDVRLEASDTIFIPAVGPQVALGGSVRHPAIYELHGETTVADLLALAGGFSPTAATQQISLERIEEAHDRAAMTVSLDAAGKATPLRDGDVLFAGHITSAFQQSVTIRGNLSNPGRFPWHAGMKLSEIMPDRSSLLTNDYWRERNRLGVPVPLFQPLRPMQSPYRGNTQSSLYGPQGTGYFDPVTGTYTQGSGQDSYSSSGQQSAYPNAYNIQPTPTQDTGNAYSNAFPGVAGLGGAAAASQNQQGNSGYSTRSPLDPSPDPDNPQSKANLTSTTLADEQQTPNPRTHATFGQNTTIKIAAPEIDWSYAVVERLDPNTLKSSLLPFNLQRLLDAHDPTQNLALQPGDIVTILSQSDIRVPIDEQTKYIRIEGEIKGAGVYSVSPDETLRDVVARAGGLTSKAYLYGASFTRESSRLFQQQRLDEYITQVSISMERSLAVRQASSQTTIDPNALQEQRDTIAQLRKLRATGRIVLEFRPDSSGLDAIPALTLEDGDILRIPSRPATVNVIGAVYGQNVFLYDPKRRVEDYVLLAGKPNPIADRKHSFIIRADGSVYSRERAATTWKNSFDATQISPGDSIVIPEQPVKPSFVRQFIDYSQIFSQFALGAAAITVIKQ